MSNLDLVVMLLSTSTMALLGAIVFSRNTHNITSKLFGALASISILWSVANYLTNHIQGYRAQLFTNKLSLFVGFLLIQAMWLLSLYFPYKLSGHRFQRRLSVVITPLVLFLTLFSGGIVASVVYRPEKDITDINIGALFYLYVLAAILFFGFIVYNFYKSFRAKGISSLQRQQTLYASIGFALAFIWAVLVAAVIPSLTSNWEISKFGAVGTWFMIIFVSYAIIRHKLFDIKLIIARFIAYVALLFTTAVIFAGAVIILPSNVIGAGRPSLPRQIYYTFAAIALAFAFQPLRRVFNRLTNNLFYQDAYDPQDFLDSLNQILVSTIELKTLLQSTSEVIEQNLKAEFCAFAIHETSYEQKRIIGSGEHKLDQETLSEALGATLGVEGKVFAADYLENDQGDLKKVMNRNDIAILVKLTSASQSKAEGVGYILLGQKKSGNPYNSQDIKILEIVANELVIAIQNALRFEEISNFNITLQQKVDTATRQLRRTNERLKLLDETKDDFISMASHQLRTPLTSVKGYLSMVLEGDAGKVNAKQSKLLDQAFVSSQRMVYLIADLLNVSRLRTGKFVVEPTPTNLAEIIGSEVDQLVETAAARGLELSYDKPKEFPVLMLDETKIRQVIMNFIDNAIYYTPAEGHIWVSLSETAQSITFSVKDDGIGVPKSEQHHLFTKFFRAGNAKKARPDGTGLGLFMAKKVIIAQGGSIIFQSHGKGSTFGFTFAKAKLRPTPDSMTTRSDGVSVPKETKKPLT